MKQNVTIWNAFVTPMKAGRNGAVNKQIPGMATAKPGVMLPIVEQMRVTE
jgi:hypothetical protein